MTTTESPFEIAWIDFKKEALAVPGEWDCSREAFAAGGRLGIEYACKQISWDVHDDAGVPSFDKAGRTPNSGAEHG